MKKIWLFVVVITTFLGFCGCEKTPVETGGVPPKLESVCDVENPLTDLPWLVKAISEWDDKVKETGANNRARIYQCTYRDGIGFVIEPCADCPDAGFILVDCEGNGLCTMGTLLGNLERENWEKFAVDFENRQLIWEYYPEIID